MDFYRRAFGWEPVFVIDEVAFLDLGGVVLSLWSGLAAALGRDTPPPGAVFLAHNVRTADEVGKPVLPY